MTETPTLNLSFLLHFMTIARPEATLKNKLLLLARLALASSSRGGFRHPIAKFRQLQSRWAFCLQFSFLRMKERRCSGERPSEPIVGASLVNGALSRRIGRVHRRAVLRDGPRNEIIDRQHLGHAGGGMPGAPDVAPARRAPLARADVDILCDVNRAAWRQVVRIETGGCDRRPQH